MGFIDRLHYKGAVNYSRQAVSILGRDNNLAKTSLAYSLYYLWGDKYKSSPNSDETNDIFKEAQIHYPNLNYVAVHEASFKYSAPLIKAILSLGWDINSQIYGGRTALMNAAQVGNVDAAKFLLNSGAKVDIEDNYGYTALVHAFETGSYDMVKLLLQYGANADYRFKKGGMSIVEYAEVIAKRPDIADLLNSYRVSKESSTGA
jgi:ankyrin repeat protein